MKSTIFLALLFAQTLAFPALLAQDLARVTATTLDLCSKDMYGRGYTHEGSFKAAQFVGKHFGLAGLQPFGQSYAQAFSMDVNAFPGKVPRLVAGGKKLEPGRDFIADPSCPTAKGKLETLYLDSAFFADPALRKAFAATAQLSDKALVYDIKHDRGIQLGDRPLAAKIASAGAVILLTGKLTFGVSRQQSGQARFMVLADRFPSQAKTVSFDVRSTFKTAYPLQNVAGFVTGTVQPDSFIVFTAHYDHLGSMGKGVYFPGANDNASGTAMLLELAYHYAASPPPYSVAFIAFAAEEAGLVGSKHYTENPLFPLENIAFLFNMDLLATGEKGLTVVNGEIHPEEFALLKSINDSNGLFPFVGKRGKAPNSDHWFFSEAGVKAFFIYLMGDWPHYHDIDDKPPVAYPKLAETFELVTRFAGALMGLEE